MIERFSHQQAQVFGEDPGLYDRFRPSYPRGLMEAVVAESGDGPVLEVGAGTGKATKALLALGKSVHAIEPDRRMAAVLEVNCGDAPLRIEHATLESSQLPLASYDLVVAAQSWHWVDRDIAYDIVAGAMIEGAVLALIWHYPHSEQGMLGAALKQLYAQLAPTIASPWPGTKAADFDPATEPSSARHRFEAWNRIEHRWQRRLDVPGLIGWLCSSSDHLLLPVEQRIELMAAVAALVAELGEDVAINMTTVAHLAYRV